MKRTLLNLLTASWLLLFVAFTVLWVRSYRVGEIVTHVRPLGREPVGPVEEGQEPYFDYVYRHVSVGIAAGGIHFVWVLTAGDPLEASEVGWSREAVTPEPMPPGDTPLKRLGFDVFWEPGLKQVLLPAWAVAAPAAVPLVLSTIGAVRRRRRDRRHLCRSCGYDLTGNVSGVCPECGISVAGAPVFEAPRDAGRAGSTEPPA